MWLEKKSPARLEKRFEFNNYEKISAFMERLENLCKKYDIYPNISFGKTFVSITIFLESEETNLKFVEFSKVVDESYDF